MKFPQTNLFKMTVSLKILGLLVCMTALAIQPLAQVRTRTTKKVVEANIDTVSAPQATVSGILNPGGNTNPSCAFLDSRNTDPAFAHITSDNGLKLDFQSPTGVFEFTTDEDPPEDREVSGDEQPGKFIRVTSSTFSITEFNSDLLITAVIIKSGDDAIVYPYNPGTFMDTNLAGPAGAQISHLTFCFAVVNNPSAADSTMAGRVVTAGGKAIAGARLTLINPFTGESRTAATNAFGFYTFTELESGSVYFVSVNHRRYKFGENTKTITLNDSLSNVDFTANQ